MSMLYFLAHAEGGGGEVPKLTLRGMGDGCSDEFCLWLHGKTCKGGYPASFLSLTSEVWRVTTFTRLVIVCPILGSDILINEVLS